MTRPLFHIFIAKIYAQKNRWWEILIFWNDFKTMFHTLCFILFYASYFFMWCSFSLGHWSTRFFMLLRWLEILMEWFENSNKKLNVLICRRHYFFMPHATYFSKFLSLWVIPLYTKERLYWMRNNKQRKSQYTMVKNSCLLPSTS